MESRRGGVGESCAVSRTLLTNTRAQLITRKSKQRNISSFVHPCNRGVCYMTGSGLLSQAETPGVKRSMLLECLETVCLSHSTKQGAAGMDETHPYLAARVFREFSIGNVW
ncbi:hypothetical protein RRG08_014811 [Elysia crispata]|uniref:Uncharacterized protein n=1 Tax=Elysia crispata TaxID=231223 RepID=A0AAE0Z8Q5_9GAST|nr:hypothetical protein RRG08_014811 [Elysia crispata]